MVAAGRRCVFLEFVADVAKDKETVAGHFYGCVGFGHHYKVFAVKEVERETCGEVYTVGDADVMYGTAVCLYITCNFGDWTGSSVVTGIVILENWVFGCCGEPGLISLITHGFAVVALEFKSVERSADLEGNDAAKVVEHKCIANIVGRHEGLVGI